MELWLSKPKEGRAQGQEESQVFDFLGRFVFGGDDEAISSFVQSKVSIEIHPSWSLPHACVDINFVQIYGR